MSQRMLVEVLSRSNHTNTILRSVFNDVTRKSSIIQSSISLVLNVSSSIISIAYVNSLAFMSSISVVCMLIVLALNDTLFLSKLNIISLRVLHQMICYSYITKLVVSISSTNVKHISNSSNHIRVVNSFGYVMYYVMDSLSLDRNKSCTLLICVSLSNHIKLYCCPNNINFFYSMGFILYQYTSLQIVTGILLALHYT